MADFRMGFPSKVWKRARRSAKKENVATGCGKVVELC
jgi:hypothetical protein